MVPLVGMYADQDVWHETVEDRERQCGILLDFCAGTLGRSAMILMGQPWDAVIFDGQKGVAYAEVKYRRHEYGRYRDYTIDCHKMEKIWEEGRKKGRWTCLIVSWEGDVRWGKVEENPYPVSLQKRRDRDELADRVYHVPLSFFERIPVLAVE